MKKNKTTVALERRGNQRFKVNAPILIPLVKGTLGGFTRDMSSRGIYFYLNSAQTPPQDHKFEFLVELPAEITTSFSCRVRCLGRVKRIEHGASNITGFAVEILKYSIERNSASKPQQLK